jgi:hypothetical protein
MKVTTIKSKVEKLFKASFIYLVPLTEWVLNLIIFYKKTRNHMRLYGFLRSEQGFSERKIPHTIH